ncbi:Plasmid pRiA4b ORF-3-like protein [Corynebacterium occultum]|uniref:Plasmid pRiA4b ORF-3-like protein n=1 Tax=Corynebacterium occultum TaxID=2675219 RepID=A0A6B8W9K1_9CORY|nr:hypothetical protein [Corynebacterium occultum]QGU08647.1 Plasmid pRiA4b ORF-3-like protein [Corynebacterium occultum]
MPSVTLHLALDGSEPMITRTVVLSSQITLVDLHEVICHAFEFSGQQPHSFLPTHPQSRTGFTLAEEEHRKLPDLLVDPYGSAEYHYGSEEAWAVTITSLGFPTERMLVPKLIDATGPDIVEGCGGVVIMAQMREAALRAISALEVDMEAADHISDHLPGLHPHQVLARLTYVDPATVASRVCFAILPGYVDGLGPVGTIHGDGTATDALANPADWPNAVLWPDPGDEDLAGMEGASSSIAEEGRDPHSLREQLPNGGGDADLLGPETIREIRDALKGFPDVTFAPGVTLPEDEGQLDLDSIPLISLEDAETITASVRWYLRFIGAGVTLTQAGYLKPALVQQVAERLEMKNYSFGKFNRESETITVLILREVLQHLGLLDLQGNKLSISELGEEYLDQPLHLAHHIALNLPVLYDPTEFQPMEDILHDWYRGNPRSGQYPECYADNYQFLLAMNVFPWEMGRYPIREAQTLTPAGKAFLGLILKLRR